MKTVIQKTYEDGFFLSEQDVRRFYQIMLDAAGKLKTGAHSSQFHVRLENGSIYELASVDDVLAIENTGQRAIEYLSISVQATPELEASQEDWRLFVRFQKNERFRSSNPILIEAEGNSRDWVVLAAGELDERAHSVRRTNFARLLDNPYLPTAFLVLGLFIGALFFSNFFKPTPAYIELEKLYQAGKVTNPIEALVFLEKAKASSWRPDSFLLYAFTFLATVLTLSVGAPKLARIMSSPYVFYWGDSMGTYQRKRNFVFIVWTVVVLGIVVGVISSYIAKSLGI